MVMPPNLCLKPQFKVLSIHEFNRAGTIEIIGFYYTTFLNILLLHEGTYTVLMNMPIELVFSEDHEKL